MEGMMMCAEDGEMGDFFDQIDDLLDFANNDNHLLGIDDFQQQQQLLPFPADNDDNVFQQTENQLEPPQFVEETNDIDIIPLEWMSQFLEDSDTIPDNSTKLECLSSSSPISVIQLPNNNSNSNANTNKSFPLLSPSSSSSSSASSCFTYGDQNNNDNNQVFVSAFPVRSRSKRPRSATPVVASLPRITIKIKPPSCSPATTTTITSESIGDSPMKKKKKTSMKNKMTIDEHLDGESDIEPENNNTNIRKCLHCAITKTPQWRLGPMGPKTLCNACGVRYKSGRLFPEYRPAASPTFVSSIHSNSHKKVVEMRNKGANKSGSCELLDYIRMQRVS